LLRIECRKSGNLVSEIHERVDPPAALHHFVRADTLLKAALTHNRKEIIWMF
jgi:hypothetical protein